MKPYIEISGLIDELKDAPFKWVALHPVTADEITAGEDGLAGIQASIDSGFLAERAYVFVLNDDGVLDTDDDLMDPPIYVEVE